MTDKTHYFDWAATAPQDAEIARQALELTLENWANPSSIHKAGTDAKKILEEARIRAAKALGVKPETLYFTSGGTESDHIPLLSLLTRQGKGSFITSAIEHPALSHMTKMMENCGWKPIIVSPDKNGFIQPEAVVSHIQDDTAFVAIMSVNNETGAVQDIRGIADAIAEKSKGGRKPWFHVDCVQAAGKIELDLNTPGIDSAAMSAHKIGGPRGIGLLYLSRQMTSFLRGGGQEKNIRSGTENVYGAAAFSMCLEKYLIRKENPSSTERFEQQMEWTRSFIKDILAIPGCTIIPHCREDEGMTENFSPWIVQASFKGIPGQVMERALSEKGYYISTGSACSQGRHSRPVLDSMGISGQEKEDAVRFSFGHDTTREAMDDLVRVLKETVGFFG